MRRGWKRRARTIIYLLQCDNCIRRQALLRVLVEEEGLGGDLSCLSRRRHGGVAGGVHAVHQSVSWAGLGIAMGRRGKLTGDARRLCCDGWWLAEHSERGEVKRKTKQSKRRKSASDV